MTEDQQILEIGNELGDILFNVFDKFIKNQKSNSERYLDKGIRIDEIDFNGYIAAILFFIKNVAHCFSANFEDFCIALFANSKGIEFTYEADTPGYSTIN